jgi:hypothetical protein
MPQHSKILLSRNEWREKAIKRANENREQRKAEKRHQEAIKELKQRIEDLQQERQDKKKRI